VWSVLGKISEQELHNYRKFSSVLEGHPTFRFAYTEAATGALGVGLSIGVGEALAARLGKRSYYTYVLLGDGEIAEGCVWEAIQIAAHYQLHNLVAIVDCNGLGQSDEVLFDHDITRYKKIFESFGWHAVIVDGHNIEELLHTFDSMHTSIEQPKIILAKTVKGYGLDFAQGKLGFHGKVFQGEIYKKAIDALRNRCGNDAQYTENDVWKPKLPKAAEQYGTQNRKNILPSKEIITLLCEQKPISTRQAFGQALAALGKVNNAVVVLDADVKNSTYTEMFEQQFPDRFFQCFIAEQNMVSMGVGFHRRGYIPFIATFAAFFSRAHDQIRMAALGQSALRLVGSHAGVAIGEDGPSQMGLEDIALMRCLPKSVLLYPCDVVSTYKLVEAMANYHEGISYLRTTRLPMESGVLYAENEQFHIGGCKVVYQTENAMAVIIAAGITVFEALKAKDILQQQSPLLSVAIIDCYSIKPIDTATIVAVAQKSGSNIVTVEDHYAEGGLGEAVRSALAHTNIKIFSLAVPDLPRSGEKSELLAWAGIDADAIANLVKKIADLNNRKIIRGW
jgi:transketolase